MDIRKCTGIIISKDGEYLVGTILYSQELRWSGAPWDAWTTRSRDNARRVANRVNGQTMLFNPVAGQLKKFDLEGKQ